MQTGRQQKDTVPVVDCSWFYDDGTKEWSNNLFGCFGDCILCILACCCSSYVFGKIASGIGAGTGAVFSAIYLMGTPIILILSLMVRGEIRHRRGIAGSVFTEFLAVCFCHVCALVQEAREIKAMTAPNTENMHRE